MLKASSSGFDKPLFVDLVQTIEALPQTIADEALDVAAQFESELEAIASYPPPRGNDPYLWSFNPSANARARRWWFANLRDGLIPTDGRHYRRSGNAKKSFRIEVDSEGDKTIIRILNTWPNSRFVFGTLSSIGNPDTRNPSHARDGWQLAKPKVDALSNQILVALIDAAIARIGRI